MPSFNTDADALIEALETCCARQGAGEVIVSYPGLTWGNAPWPGIRGKFRAYLSLRFGDIRFKGPAALTFDLRLRRLPEPALPCEAFEIMTRGVRGKDRL
jgi:hypothetical protein